MKINKKVWLLLFGFVILTVHLAFIFFTSLGYNFFGQNFRFETTGQFGDSFGSLSAIMASIAAVAAAGAYFSQREQLSQSQRDRANDKKISEKRDFETTFFNLLTLFGSVVKEVKIENKWSSETSRGREGLQQVLNNLKWYGHLGNSDQIKASFKEEYAVNRDDLAHYFRLFYHIVKYINESKIGDRILYIRLLRATLSDAEITLIALNCIHGGGQRKLKPLVEKYAILHNISVTSAKEWLLVKAFDAEAFGDRSDVFSG